MARKNENDVVGSYDVIISKDGKDATFTINWESGETTSYSTEVLPENIKMEIFAYGLKQKLVDRIANRSKEGWSEEDCLEKLDNLWDSLKKGSFTSREAGSSLSQKLADLYAKRDELNGMSEREYKLVSRFISKESVEKEIRKIETKIAKGKK